MAGNSSNIFQTQLDSASFNLVTNQRFDGDAARRRRKELGLKVRDVAAHLGVTAWSIYGYEKNRVVYPPEYGALIGLYELEPGDLLVDDEDDQTA